MMFLQLFAASCHPPQDSFFGFPYWYKYLDGTVANGVCVPSVQELNDVWLIAAAIIEMLLRLSALAAIAMVIYGSVQYVTSQADPGNLEKARHTITNALIGLVIAIVAITVVSYVAGRFV